LFFLLLIPNITSAYIQSSFDIGGKYNPIYFKEVYDPYKASMDANRQQSNLNTQKENSLKSSYGVSAYYDCYSENQSSCGLKVDMSYAYNMTSCLNFIQYCLERKSLRESYNKKPTKTDDQLCREQFGQNWKSIDSSTCGCKDGYAQNNGECVTYDQSCSIEYPNTFFLKISETGTRICDCKNGYMWDGQRIGCVIAPIIPTKTNDQICQESLGLNSGWDGTKDNITNNPNCYCKFPYQLNEKKTNCILISQTKKEELKVPVDKEISKTEKIEDDIKENTGKTNSFIINSKNSFFGLYEGAGLVRSCPSFDCKIIKYGAICPSTDILFKEEDWYKVKFTERGIYDDLSSEETCGGERGKLLPKSSWVTFEGWMPAQVIPPQIRQNISEKISEDEIVSDKDNTENLTSVGVVDVVTSTEKTKSKNLWSKIKSWFSF
ncbi:hypothetical protein KKC45_02845, partial [Patescibacteria group bacterium]|nr:hypothetical protein [Patescibacteria group bacterium]